MEELSSNKPTLPVRRFSGRLLLLIAVAALFVVPIALGYGFHLGSQGIRYKPMQPWQFETTATTAFRFAYGLLFLAACCASCAAILFPSRATTNVARIAILAILLLFLAGVWLTT